MTEILLKGRKTLTHLSIHLQYGKAYGYFDNGLYVIFTRDEAHKEDSNINEPWQKHCLETTFENNFQT